MIKYFYQPATINSKKILVLVMAFLINSYMMILVSDFILIKPIFSFIK